MTSSSKTVTAIRNLLNTGDELDRCCSCRTLGILGNSSVVSDLVERLRDEDIDVCLDAINALGQLADSSAIEPLIDSLTNDPDGDVKTAVVTALGSIGNTEVAPHLIEIALAKPENLEWDDEGDWDCWWDMQREAVKALGKMKIAEAVPTLVTLLKDEDEISQDIEDELFTALITIGGAGETAVIDQLISGKPRQRRRAVKALASSTSPESSTALLEALKDSDDSVRSSAVEALAQHKSGAPVAALLLMLKDSSNSVRQSVMMAMSRLGSDHDISSKSAIEPDTLLELINDNDPLVRATALGVASDLLPISDLNSKTLQEILLKRVVEPHIEVASAACKLAGNLKDPKTEQALVVVLMDHHQEPMVRREAALALGKRNEESALVLANLTKSLADSDQVVRLSALSALMELARNASSISEQIPASLAIVIAALRGEIKLGDDEKIESEEISDEEPQGIIEELVEEEKAEETPIITSTLDAIIMEGEEAAIQQKTSRADTGDLPTPESLPDVEDASRLDEYLHLVESDREKFKTLCKPKILDIKTDVRSLSARILGECARPEVVYALLDALQNESTDVQIDAIDSLTRIAMTAPETAGLANAMGPITHRLYFGEPPLQIVSAKALGIMANQNATPSLLEKLNDEAPMLRSQIIDSLVQLLQANKIPMREQTSPVDHINYETVVEALLERLDDEHPIVRRNAAQAVAGLGQNIGDHQYRQNVVERIIQVGLTSTGGDAEGMGSALRRLDSELAEARLLKQLNESKNSLERRFTIEMLEGVLKPAA
ncbi:MAG: HEAT repeat domain-containing protein [Gammaproteobacteria bacterium]|nr:HEAT repeat domain-containing protein [Gammaproteobacteria bacterium]